MYMRCQTSKSAHGIQDTKPEQKTITCASLVQVWGLACSCACAVASAGLYDTACRRYSWLALDQLQLSIAYGPCKLGDLA